jgi:hypothetical protein
MEDWTDLTTASWEGVLSPEELNEDVIPAADRTRELTKFASEVRSMIASWSANTLSANPLKIPEGFVGQALLVVRNRLLTGIPNYTIDDDRREQGKQAAAFFMEVARGKIRPQPASDATATEVPSEKPAGVEVVSSRPSRTGSTRMNGL